MMPHLVLFLVLLTSVLLGAVVLLVRHVLRRSFWHDQLSAVTRQHIELLQGGSLNDQLLETVKSQFRMLLEQGSARAVEARLRAGMSYVVHVRALAEIGSETAGRILERQLQRRHSTDGLEQCWYWIDVAGSLRAMGRQESLPHLLRCFEHAEPLPLSHYFAAETVCFMGFPGYLREADGPLGQAALRILHRCLEGLRHGIPPHVVTEARLGEAVEQLWDHRPDVPHPLVVRVFAEARRLLRRASHSEAVLADEQAEQEAFHWQVSRLATLEPVLDEYLDEAPRQLAALLPAADAVQQADVLRALIDLRADVAPAVLPLLSDPTFQARALAVEGLAWSRDPQVATRLRQWALAHIDIRRRARRRRRATPPRRSSAPVGLPYQAILRTLRRHPSRETETFLLVAARDWDPTFRVAAVGSLGWWEPVHRPAVLAALQEARRDPSRQVRLAGRAALARLGQRDALQAFRRALASEEPRRVHEAVHLIASEGLTLLWPDLDRLADAEDVDVAHHAREALECLGEDLSANVR